MNRAGLTDAIRAYRPWNEQESADREAILGFLAANEDAFVRTCPNAHMTASAWVVNRDRSKVLMVYHKIYDSWSWTGGHADGEEDLLSVAVREVKEETGVKTVTPVSDDIYSLEVLTVDGHEKRGRYVSSHLHMNVTYLLEADETEELRVCEDENRGVSWFTLEGALEASTEPWFVQRIYAKLNDKLSAIGADSD